MNSGPKKSALKKTKEKTGIVQINMDRSRATLDLVHRYIRDEDIQMIIIAEPNRNAALSQRWYVDKKLDAAIAVPNGKMAVRRHGRGSGYVWVETEHMVVYSCYISPSVDLRAATQYMAQLSANIRRHSKPVIVAGDFNAKSAWWGSPKEDRRGTLVAEWATQERMMIANEGDKPTFVRGAQTSHIDLTFYKENTATVIEEWRVLDEETLGCHQLIRYVAASTIDRSRAANEDEKRNKRGWRLEEGTLENFKESLRSRLQRAEADGKADAAGIIKCVVKASNETLRPLKASRNGKRPVYWWSENIAEARRDCIAKKRTMTRVNGKATHTPQEAETAKSEYREARRVLKKRILQSKKDAWKKVIEELDRDIWGNGYRIVTKRLGARKTARISAEQQEEEARKLFPAVEDRGWQPRAFDKRSVPEISAEELQVAAERIRKKKAPGPDQISPEIAKVVAQSHPGTLLAVFNDSIRKANFPKAWRRAVLVLIEKPAKEGVTSGYRPICLLDTVGKILEAVLERRLREELEEKGALSDRQYGFRKGRSAIDAMKIINLKVKEATNKATQHRRLCLLVTIDIRNAFNTARWSVIIEELERWQVSRYLIETVKSYLTDRSVLVGEDRIIEMSCGVPQGSILGPLLWNVQYDGVLRLELPQGAETIGYADDLALIVTAKGKTELEATANVAIQRITEWIEDRGLSVAPQKTEAVLLAARRNIKEITIRIKGENITSRGSVKYLGVTFSKGAHFSNHIRDVTGRASLLTARLTRIMPSVGGPRASKRRAIYSTVRSVMLYAAPVWHRVMEFRTYNNMAVRVHRKMVLKVCAAYRTTSTEAAEVIAGIPPLDLQTSERVKVSERGGEKAQAAAETLAAWQQRWNDLSEKAQWPKRLIPDISTWVKRKFGEVNHHLTQVLSGHGCFQAYLHKCKIVRNASCKFCAASSDTADHTLFRCPRWETERMKAVKSLRSPVEPENFVRLMLRDEESWNTLAALVAYIMTDKLEKERQEQEAERETTD